MNMLEGEGKGTPCDLASATKCLDVPVSRLSKAEMGCKPAGKQGYIVAIGKLVQQGLMQRFDRGGRFGGQVKSGAVARVGKEVEALQSYFKRLRQTASLGQDGGDPFKFCWRPERVEERDMWHPAPEVSVVLLAQGLNRRPEIIGRNGHHRCSVCFSVGGIQRCTCR